SLDDAPPRPENSKRVRPRFRRTFRPRPPSGRVTVSETCCPFARVFKAGALTVAALSVALAVTVLAPWRSVDAAAPAAGDDPLVRRDLVRPVPAVLEQRG